MVSAEPLWCDMQEVQKSEIFDILATPGDPKTIVMFSHNVRRKHDCFEKTGFFRDG